MRVSYAIAVVVVAGLGAYFFFGGNSAVPASGASAPPASRAEVASVVLPELTGNALIGEKVFATKCAACHGPNGTGNSEAGPPLIHKIYEPSHHGDAAFLNAAANGVRAHHWRFGDMPPVEGVTQGDVMMVVDYIRAVQRANGIN